MDLPKGKKRINSNWMFIIKYEENGKLRGIKQIGGKKLYLDLWNRFLRNILTSNQDKHNTNVVILNRSF